MTSSHRLLQFLSDRRSSISPLLILVHNYPDPDALASAFALQYLARRFFAISSKIAYGGFLSSLENKKMVRILDIPLIRLSAAGLERHAHVAVVDTQPGFDNNPFPSDKKATLVIDQHHMDVRPQADLAIIDTDCGATSVILAQALFKMAAKVPSRVATALVYGILTDTSNLYRARRPDIIETYLNLLPYCDFAKLIRIQNIPRPKIFFEAYFQALKNASFCQGFMISHLGQVHDPVVIAHAADFLMTYRQAAIVCCTGRCRHRLHVSLRGRSARLVASDLLRDIFVNRAQAGGHENIAGGSFLVDSDREADWDKAERTITARFFDQLRIDKKLAQPFLKKTRCLRS